MFANKVFFYRSFLQLRLSLKLGQRKQLNTSIVHALNIYSANGFANCVIDVVLFFGECSAELKKQFLQDNFILKNLPTQTEFPARVGTKDGFDEVVSSILEVCSGVM